MNLDFMFGKGFLWAEDVELSDWLTLESLRMEIPDLTFPFDAGGGVDRFQNTRCQIREIELSIDESGLADRLNEAADSLGEFHDVRVQFQEDTVHVSLQLRAFGSDTHLSFRAALLPPEPPRSDEVHLSLYDYRWFGPLPYPGRLLAFEWLTGVLNTPPFSAPGEGRPFQVGVAGDIASFRPFKLLLIELFPACGWKLPNLSGVVLDDVRIQPGQLVIRATSQEGRWESEAEPIHELRNSREGRRALAAYESKDLFAPADEALFAGHLGEALELLSNYREKYGLHPQLASRILDCLLADPTASHLAEAKSICRELIEDNPDDLRSHLAHPIMTLVSRRDDEALEDFEALSAVLKQRGDTADWALAELAVADILEETSPREAADRLREVLKALPKSLPVLERLRALHQRLGDQDQLEDVLKRLTGVYTDREKLRDTYLELARHLMHREGELGEARHYLQKALNIDSEHLEALEALGESYALSDKPMRAVKALSSAARIAESRDQLARARELQFRIAGLWREDLGEPEQALLSVRRAISTTETELDAASSLARPQAIEFARQLEFAAELCEQLGRSQEALGHWSESVSLLQRLVDADDVPSRTVGHASSPDPNSPLGRLAKAHRHLARLYVERDRSSTAESHWRRILELDPEAEKVVAELESYYKKAGQAEKLLDLLDERLEESDTPADTAIIHRKIADIREALGEEKAAEEHRETAEGLAESSDLDQPDNPWQHDSQTEPVVESLYSRDEAEPDGPEHDGPEHDGPEHHEPDDHEPEILPPETDQPEADDPEANEANREDPDPDEPDPSASRLGSRHSDPNNTSYSPLTGKTPSESGVGDTITGDPLAESGFGSNDSSPAPWADNDDEPKPSPSLPWEDDENQDSGDDNDSSGFELPSLDIDPESSGFGRTDEGHESDHPTRQLSAAASDVLESATQGPTSDTDEEQNGQQDGEETTTEIGDDDELESFRSEYHDLLTGDAESSERSEPAADESDEEETSSSFDIPSPSTVEELSEVEDEESTDNFKEKLKQAAHQHRSQNRSDDPPPEDVAETVRADALASPEKRIQDARASDDETRLAAVLDEILQAHEHRSADAPLSDKRALELRRELAELYYYDLQDTDAAKPHLEILRQRDPEKLGSESEVLRALESIYEREGNLDGRISILQERLEQAESPEQATNFRMLLAQAFWHKKEAPKQAKRLLDETLDDDPDHEGAHRLLADLYIECEDYGPAVGHLSTALELAGDGLDALELQRKLADLLFEQLDQPETAADYYAEILDESPGDARALEGLQQCRRALGDWEGYLESLRRELAVELGYTEAVDFEDLGDLDPDLVDQAGRMAASQIAAEAADVYRNHLEAPERAHRLYGRAAELWSEHLEALEKRIDLDRTLDKPEALAEDLSRYAEGLLDPTARYASLREAAEIADDLDRPERASRLAERALEAADQAETPPEGLEAIREMLDEEQNDHDR